MLKRITIKFTILFFIIFVNIVDSAEVYYLSQVDENTTAQSTTSYTLSQRIKDIFDFSSDRDYSQRSGILTGRFTQEVDFQEVSGNKSKSFLIDGWKYISELNLNLKEKILKGFNFEVQSFLRKTDNIRVETENEVKLKQVKIRVYNIKNFFEFGDFYKELSPFVLGSSLYGFNFDLKPNNFSSYHLILARKYREENISGSLQRNVFGFKTEQYLFRDSDLFSNFRLGLQLASSFKNSNSFSYDAIVENGLKNIVFSIDGDINFVKYFSFSYELANSGFLQDDSSQTIKDMQYATALRLQPTFNYKKLNLRYLYYYVQPKFYTEFGSASSDKIQHQLTLGCSFSDKFSFNIVENYYFDRLSGSNLDKRTINDNKYLNFIIKPFNKNFSLRPYINYLVQSTEGISSTEKITKTAGFNLNGELKKNISFGSNYEYRVYEDKTNDKLENFNRLGLNFNYESFVFKRRISFTSGVGFEERKTKDDIYDLNLNFSINGQYDVVRNIILRLGYNINNMNTNRANSDFITNRYFVEVNFDIYRKKNTNFVLSFEKNNYKHEDKTQNYEETKFVGKFSSNF